MGSRMGRSVVEIMRRDFVRTDVGESLESARQTMRLGRLRHLLVTRGDTLVGLLSYRDLLEAMLGSERRAHPDSTVADAMRPAPLWVVAPDASLGEAADCLCRYGLGCLPVTGLQGELLGLVTETDLLRAAYGLPRL